MAVTINNSPTTYTPSDNPIIWRFSSDQTAQPNFRFIVEVYVNSVLYSTHDVFVERSNYAHFDGSQVAQQVCEFETPDLTLIAQENKNWQEMYIRVREYYGTPLAFGASATSADIYPFKARLSNEEFDVYRTQATQYIQGGVTRRFNTYLSKDINLEMRLNDNYFDGIINDFDSRTVVKVNLYDDTDTLISTAQVALKDGIISHRISLINLNPALWIAQTSLTSGDYAQCVYFEYFILETSGNTRVSEIRRVYINAECGYFGRALSWLNKFGSFDNFLFFHNAQNDTEISQQSFARQYGGWVSDEYVLDATVSGTSDIVKNMRDKARIVSDYMTMDVFNWLTRSLLESPFVLAQYEGQTPYKVLPRNATYSEAQDRFDELFSLVVECELPNERQSQTI
jgi:hypothetical protein